ncbi:MAG: PorT family protein [Bacteroidales bacterium]|nr:PorT family protein [Bacteroidales bacterium]
MMKKLIIIFAIFLTGNLVNAQDLSYGGEISVGAATINTGNSANTLNILVDSCNCLKMFHISSKSGLSYSFGAFAEYNISEKIKLGINGNYLSTSFQINTIHMFDEVDREIMNANNNLTIGSLNLPLYVKYIILPDNDVYIKVGGGFNIITNGKVKTEETLTTEVYNSSGTFISSSNGSTVEYKANLDYSTSVNIFALFGAGIELNNNIEIGVDYILPFSENSIYTTDQDYDTKTHKGNVFTETFINELKTTGNDLNEYKFGSLSLTFSYKF